MEDIILNLKIGKTPGVKKENSLVKYTLEAHFPKKMRGNYIVWVKGPSRSKVLAKFLELYKDPNRPHNQVVYTK